MIVCACHQVKKMLSAEWVLKQISGEVQENARIGLVGANGSGKTTLLKCIAGIETPDQGEVFIGKRVKVGYLAQIPQVAPEVTVKEVLKQPFAKLLEMEQKMNQLSEQMGQQYEDEQQLNRLLHQWDQLREQFEEEGGYQIESFIAQVAKGLGIGEEMWTQPFM